MRMYFRPSIIAPFAALLQVRPVGPVARNERRPALNQDFLAIAQRYGARIAPPKVAIDRNAQSTSVPELKRSGLRPA